MENFKFDTYRSNKKGEIVLESKSEQSAVNKIRALSNIDLKESIDKEVIHNDLDNEQLLVFYKGNLIRKI